MRLNIQIMATIELELDLAPISQPSIIDYARSQGICVDYTTEPLQSVGIEAPSSASIDRDFYNLSDVTVADTTQALTKERLTINRDAILFLKSTYSLQNAPILDTSAEARRRWMLGLKLELPILKSDYELDLLSFGSTASPDLRKLQIPSEVIVKQNDEGFDWPTKYLDYPAQCDAKVKAEKISVSKDTLIYLQNTVKDAWIQEDSESILNATLQYKLTQTTQPITPPLLPQSPIPTPYIPSSPANRLPLASESSDSVAAEAQALHNQILTADSLTRQDSDSSDSMLLDLTHTPKISPLFEPRSLPTLKRQAEDLKVEGPLTPIMFSTSPMKKLKSVTFAEMPHEYIPDQLWREEKLDGDCDDDVDELSSIDFDELFPELEPLAKEVKKKTESEQLSGADTAARVDVPDVDFSLPVAPWNEYSQRKGGKHRPAATDLQAQAQFLLKTKREDLKSMNSWHGLSVPERELTWGFLMTKVSTLSLEEKLYGESEVDRIITEMTSGSIATSTAEVWKREGLRILDQDEEEEEEEEELEPDGNEERRDMEYLLRKRKLEIEEQAAEQHQKISRHTVRKDASYPAEAQESSRRGETMPVKQLLLRSQTKPMEHIRERPPARRRSLQRPDDNDNGLMFGGFSATTALHRFMETRGKPIEAPCIGTSKGSQPEMRPHSKTPTLIVQSRGPCDQRVSQAQEATNQLQETDDTQRQTCKDMPLTLPCIPNNLAPCSFVISSTFLQQRSLLKRIEQLYPVAELVYRDYTLPHSPSKEAEIILSPSTGLIFTTLQKIKQRALPGQPDRSKVKEHVLDLQSRYERLVVVVSEGLSHEMEELGSSRPDDARDQDALKAFDAFATQVEGDVLVQYVRGGEKALANAIVIEMVKYGLPYGSVDIGDIKPVSPETSWECFLRRVGLNPFAAQAIVAWLKLPINVQVPLFSSSPNSPPHPKSVPAAGLSRFLTMSEEERIHCFQALMGGSRILRRASKLLDQEWVSAAHGFRM
ncbi:nucleoporin nup49 [Pyrenophora seminiperda CCB06]|uniref:Nucleoporin nup49 n=1 Tax=Pyrenophora seminiperda CCB06 TaxID=1302712 RepID=A0A3M7MDY0_9PLEO|nr:nucleoporin nup49 [Pyrenophora seminiperda CCB06]